MGDTRTPRTKSASQSQPQTNQVQTTQTPLSKSTPQGQLLLGMIAISGEYPADNIHRLIPSASYAKKILTALTNDNLLKTVNKDGIKGYRLETKGKRNLMAAHPARFGDYLEGSADTNKLRSDETRRLRLHSAAEVYTLMYNAGVQIYKDTKPKVFQLDAAADPSQSALEPAPVVTAPCFYSSREQKGEDVKFNAIRGSRAAGTLLTPTHVYAVYNAGKEESLWRYKIETEFRVKTQDYICRQRHQYYGDDVNGLMIGGSFDILEKYLNVQAKAQAGHMILTKIYRHFYFITNDLNGEAQLKLLCDNERMTALRTSVLNGLLPPDTKYPIVHDMLTEDGNPVLFCCQLDVPRLVQFKKGILLHEKAGLVFGFDFQRETIAKYLGASVEFKPINLERVMEWLFPNKRAKRGVESM